MRMKQVIVGRYSIGREYVEVVLREGTGGDFWLMPEHGKIPRIKIGADEKEWKDVFSALIHEATEFIYDRLTCRYATTNDIGQDNSYYLFIVPHTIFSDSCSRLAEFLTKCTPDMYKEWKKWNKEGK